MFKIKGFLKLLFIKKLVKVQTSVLQGNKRYAWFDRSSFTSQSLLTTEAAKFRHCRMKKITSRVEVKRALQERGVIAQLKDSLRFNEMTHRPNRVSCRRPAKQKNLALRISNTKKNNLASKYVCSFAVAPPLKQPVT